MQAGSKLASLLMGSGWRIVGTAVVTAIGIGLAKFAVVSILVRLETPGMYLRLQDAILTGVFAALAVSAALEIASERRKILLQQVQTIANLNHELRNALEVILANEYLTESSKGAAILESVQRIDRTLDKIVGTKPRIT
jgi:signal transduction histidine kinase